MPAASAEASELLSFGSVPICVAMTGHSALLPRGTAPRAPGTSYDQITQSADAEVGRYKAAGPSERAYCNEYCNQAGTDGYERRQFEVMHSRLAPLELAMPDPLKPLVRGSNQKGTGASSDVDRTPSWRPTGAP